MLIAGNTRLYNRRNWEVVPDFQATSDRAGMPNDDYRPAKRCGEMVQRHVAEHVPGADWAKARRITVTVFGLEQFIPVRLADICGDLPSAGHRNLAAY